MWGPAKERMQKEVGIGVSKSIYDTAILILMLMVDIIDLLNHFATELRLVLEFF